MKLDIWFNDVDGLARVTSPVTGNRHVFQLGNLLQFIQWLESKECFQYDWMCLKAVRHPATGRIVVFARSNSAKEGVLVPFMNINEDSWDLSVQDLRECVTKFVDSVHRRILGDSLLSLSMEERNFAMLQRLSFAFEREWPQNQGKRLDVIFGHN